MSGACIMAGAAAFVLFAVYDINSVCYKKKVLKAAFSAGFLLLAAATGGLMADGWDSRNGIRTFLFLTAAAGFLLLLLYTLFFALPFKETYVRENALPEVCSEGMYALCRHPGILWFVGLYGCLAAALPRPDLITGAVIFCMCNILYAVLQDVWTFPRYFSEYDRYKMEVPFLIPTGSSIRRCIRTMKSERKHV